MLCSRMLRATKVDGHVKHGWFLRKDRTVFCLVEPYLSSGRLRGAMRLRVLVLFAR